MTNYDGRISKACKDKCKAGECGCPRTVDGCGGCCGCLGGCAEGYAEQQEETTTVADRLATHTYRHPGSCACGEWKVNQYGEVDWQRQWRLHVAADVVAVVRAFEGGEVSA